MLLTITTEHEPATDLGFLLHKHPGRLQSFTVPFGQARVVYPEADDARCTAALVLDVDPIGLVRRGRGAHAFALAEIADATVSFVETEEAASRRPVAGVVAATRTGDAAGAAGTRVGDVLLGAAALMLVPVVAAAVVVLLLMTTDVNGLVVLVPVGLAAAACSYALLKRSGASPGWAIGGAFTTLPVIYGIVVAIFVQFIVH